MMRASAMKMRDTEWYLPAMVWNVTSSKALYPKKVVFSDGPYETRAKAISAARRIIRENLVGFNEAQRPIFDGVTLQAGW